jgi:hypothetical protein
MDTHRPPHFDGTNFLYYSARGRDGYPVLEEGMDTHRPPHFDGTNLNVTHFLH